MVAYDRRFFRVRLARDKGSVAWEHVSVLNRIWLVVFRVLFVLMRVFRVCDLGFRIVFFQ